MIGPLSYIGGKNRLASTIIRLLPEHTTYVEPFAGGAQVFFHKQPSKVEVLNDLDGEIVNFYRVCQWHYQELVRHLEFCTASRRLHELFAAANPETLTDVQRAARFFYLQKNSFGGLVLKRNFHYGVLQNPNYNPERIPEILRQTHERLQRVQIECLPYEEVLKRYDRATTFFYLDPPYWERTLYKFNFKEADFLALAERLRRVKGKFILSLNDTPEVRQIFSAFHVQNVELIYTAQTKPGKRYPELVIRNFSDPLSAGAQEKTRERISG
jgi:DNA adenine methylase